jgi:hypothetical protein
MMLDITSQKNHRSLSALRDSRTVSTGGVTAEIAKRNKEVKYALIALAFLGTVFVCEIVYILFCKKAI